MKVANTLAYNNMAIIITQKSFIVQTPRVHLKKKVGLRFPSLSLSKTISKDGGSSSAIVKQPSFQKLSVNLFQKRFYDKLWEPML
jgi:hypothetical protein